MRKQFVAFSTQESQASVDSLTTSAPNHPATASNHPIRGFRSPDTMASNLSDDSGELIQRMRRLEKENRRLRSLVARLTAEIRFITDNKLNSETVG